MNKQTLGTVFFAFLLFLNACKSDKNPAAMLGKTGTATDLPGLATPIQLSGPGTEVVLEDYFMDVQRIDSVSIKAPFSAVLSGDKKKVEIKAAENAPLLSDLKVFVKGTAYDILVKASTKKKATFSLKDKGYKSVQAKGEMNEWNPQKSNFTNHNGTWEWSLELNPGKFAYLFVVDGKEMKDPVNLNTVPNGNGGFNSLLDIPRPDPAKAPSLFTSSSDEKSIIIGVDPAPTEIYAYWENQRLETCLTGNTAHLEIPAAAAGMTRSTVRVWSYNETGLSNDLLIPLENGKVLNKPDQVKRSDNEGQTMYFVLIDRFNNGNKSNDAPVKDSRLTEKTNYWGGDIAGITQKIKDGYFKSLNINSLWISPITQNPREAFQEYPEPHRWFSGYHGYWPILSSQVDDRFGTADEMKELVKAAHDNGINILLDYVTHHVHIQHPMYKAHPDWITKLDLPDGRKNIRIWDEQRLTTWFDTFIPTLDLSKPEMIEMQTDSTMFWVKQYGLDGYRHDATKHISQDFWRRLTRKLKEQVEIADNKHLYQIGETYGSRDLIQSYIGSGMLDSQFDFNFYFDAREVIAKDNTSFNLVANTLQESFNYYGYHNSMGYISGNHDQPRFISLAGGDLKFTENDKEAGFSRFVGVGDPIGYKRLQMMEALNIAIPGVPVIFYGDEIGIPGAGDPDNRRPMRFSGLTPEEMQTKEITAKLFELRRNRLSLIYGETHIVHQKDMTFAIARDYFGEWTITVFNKDKKEQSITFDLPARFSGKSLETHFNGKVSVAGTKITVVLPPVSFEVLTSK